MRHSCQEDELIISLCVHTAKQFHLSPDLPVTAVVALVDHVPTPKPKLGETSPRSRSGDCCPLLDGMKDWKPLWPVIFWTCRSGWGISDFPMFVQRMHIHHRAIVIAVNETTQTARIHVFEDRARFPFSSMCTNWVEKKFLQTLVYGSFPGEGSGSQKLL
jgi:hypothetical protein